MSLWFRLAFKEVRNNSRFSLFFIINLTLGLVGFVALDSFKNSIRQHVEKNSKSILTGDLSISSNQPFTPKELEVVGSVLGPEREEAEQVRFFSMVATEQNSRLVQVIVLDRQFPLYGKIELKQGGTLGQTNARQQLLTTPTVWAGRDLLIALGRQTGDVLNLGDNPFEITDVVLEDPSSAISTFAGLPKVYIGIDQMMKTGLIQRGSRVRYERFYKLPTDANMPELVKELRRQLEILYPGSPKIRIQTHQGASEQLGRVLNYLNDYLGLVALIALFLAGVGGAYLFRSFLSGRFKEMAIMMSLGSTRKEAYLVALLQIVMLGTVSAIIASVLAVGALPLLPALLQDFLPKGFESQIGSRSIVLAFFLGTLGSVICCLPILTRIRTLNPIMLFHENLHPSQNTNISWSGVLSYLPALIAYWGLAIWQSKSLIVGSAFIGMFLFSLLVLGGVAWGILVGCGLLSNRQGVNGKIALRNLNRNRMGAISCFLAIGLGSLLLNLIPQLQQGLLEEISQPTHVKVPSFFLFDIQPEQINDLQTYLQEEDYKLSYLSPMIRARLEAVNGQTFESKSSGDALTREQEVERRFRNRGFNLTYRDGLADSEAIVDGRPLASQYDFDSEELPEISLEMRFASRLGLNIGDILTFDVQSVPIEGKVVNLRKVKWNSFQPNFFIVFQPGVLEEAPKTYLAAISNVEADRKITLQNGVVQRFSNVSIIDVSRVVSRILEITEQISWAIRSMAYLSILVGLVVLYSIARHEVQSRFWEINLLKVLGARFQDVRTIIQIEFGILGFFRGFVRSGFE